MKYPTLVRKINRLLGYVAGCLCLSIAFLAVYEAISRYVFRSPTSWSLDTSCNIHLWAMFLAGAFTYQEHGHVRVDILLDVLDKYSRTRTLRRTMVIAGYVLTLVFLGVLFYGSWEMAVKAVSFRMMTVQTIPIPSIWLYSGMVAGCALMIITILLIILDLLTTSQEYL